MPEEGGDLARAVRLLGHLRDLARSRRPARDLAEHDRVHWLADLPGDVYVEADAGPGDVLFSVPVIPLTPPAVLEEFDGWLALRHWYRVLRDLAEQAQDVVLAAGLLAWRPPDGPPVRDHLLNTPVRIVVDERTGRIDVVLHGHAELRDRDLLAGRPGYRPADWLTDAVRAGQGFGLNASCGDVLRKWGAAAFPDATEPVVYREDWAAEPAGPAPSVPRLRLAPALVARPQGRTAVAAYHDRLIDLLRGGTPVPSGLARFLAGRPQVLHIADRKPQTVPDIVAGLLVRGHRVLVATSGATASGTLRAALPPGLAALAVADPAAAAAAMGAVHARAAAHDRRRHDVALVLMGEREAAAEQDLAELSARLRDAEAQDAADLGPGYRGGRGELTRRLRAEAPELSWLPVAADLPPGPPISRAEAAELVVLLADETTERKARTGLRDVDPGTLPSAPYVRTLIEAEAAAIERAARSESGLARRLRDGDVTVLARLDGAASIVAAALRDLGLDGHPSGWNTADLAVRAFADALAHRRPLIWSRVAEMTSRARWADRALRALEGHRIVLPDGDRDLRGLASIAQDLREYLGEGGTLKRGPLKPAVQRQADPLLHGTTVDGVAPTTPELLDLVQTEIGVRLTCRELQYVWEAAGISFPADPPHADRVARFVRAHARLARVHDAVPAVEETRRLLDRAGAAVPLDDPHQWHAYTAALSSALEGLGAGRATADVDALRDAIGPPADDDPPELHAALAAIDDRDADGYARALDALATARHERALQLRCEELIGRVRAVHPDLANLMLATDGDEAWRQRTERWDEAWAWARASGRLAATARSPEMDRLRTDVAQARERLDAVRAELAETRAWGAVLTRPESAVPSEVLPAWFLPLWRIPEILPPRPDSFDVVIVDGEHGAGAEALFLLWLAPRTILVGPPGPDIPPSDGEALSQDALTAETPLFTLLTASPTPPPQADPAPRAPTAPEPEPHVAPPTPEPLAPPQPRVREPETARPPEPPAREVEPVRRPGPEPVGPPEPRVRGAEPARSAEAREPGSEPAQIRRGRSIAAYKRHELVEFVGRVAAREPDLTDDQLVELVARLMECPEDEALLVGARLRYAVTAYRERTGYPGTE